MTDSSTKIHEKKPIQFYHRGRRAHGGKTNTLHHEEHEGNEVNPGNAALRSGILDFAVPATNALAVGSRPASRRWRVRETIFCLQGKP